VTGLLATTVLSACATDERDLLASSGV
jgi:hypothetical protein